MTKQVLERTLVLLLDDLGEVVGLASIRSRRKKAAAKHVVDPRVQAMFDDMAAEEAATRSLTEPSEDQDQFPEGYWEEVGKKPDPDISKRVREWQEQLDEILPVWPHRML